MFFCYSLVGETFRKGNVKLMKSNNFGWQTNRRPKEPVLPAGHSQAFKLLLPCRGCTSQENKD